jgi:hypothetical protein
MPAWSLIRITMTKPNKQLVSNWFGEQFFALHPLIQKLHRNGGTLEGTVDISFGYGLAGFIGKRLAKKLSIPVNSTSKLTVNISPKNGYLYWQRCFDDNSIMLSTFEPVGTIQEGYWLEKTGKFTLKLTVNIINGGWYWHCLGYEFGGIKLPKILFPKATAYKTIIDENYHFHVSFSLPVLGKLLSYSGQLSITD